MVRVNVSSLLGVLARGLVACGSNNGPGALASDADSGGGADGSASTDAGATLGSDSGATFSDSGATFSDSGAALSDSATIPSDSSSSDSDADGPLDSGAGGGSDGGGSTGSLFYGINGHVNQYNFGPFSVDRAILQDLGMTVYRNDVSDANGAATLASLVAALQGSGIDVLPVMTPGLDGTDEQTNYNEGYALGQAVANKLKGLVTRYECGNELENGIVSNDGNAPSDYDSTQWPAYRGIVSGMIDGVKSVDPNALVSPAAVSWLHFGAYEMLWNGTNPDGSGGAPQVRWDFTPLHWYSDMGDVEHACGGSGCYNVLQRLQSDFGKPIWLTEFGFRPTTDAAEAAYIPATLPAYIHDRSTYNVQNIMWYDLFDDESGNYGLIQSDGTTHKTAYAAMKSFIAANPM